jgi:hypothetical protein
MSGKHHIIRRALTCLGLASLVAAFLVPAAGAMQRGDGSAGIVASTLGSPDPRDAATGTDFAAGLVPSTLGSPDPRDTLGESFRPSIVAGTLGSPDVRDSAQAAEAQIVHVSSDGFDWRDAGIGAIGGVGAALLLAGGLLLTLRPRVRASAAMR